MYKTLRGIKQNNAGITLVELIVAFAVGAVIAGSIASIIAISTRLYSNESTNVAGQYEIQTTLNQTVDSIESAQWFAYSEEDDGTNVVNTTYVALGKIAKDASGHYFEGEIFTDDYASRDAKGRFNVYMNRYDATANRLAIPAADATHTIEDQARTAVLGKVASIKNKKYLLGEGATKYVVTLDSGDNRFIDYSGTPVGPCKGYYENPIIFSVDIDFAKDSMTGEVTKHIDDTVTLRNHIDKILYIEERGGLYEPKKQ